MVIGNGMWAYTSRFTNIWSQIKQISVVVSHLMLWVAVARHNFRWVKNQIIYFSASRVNIIATICSYFLPYFIFHRAVSCNTPVSVDNRLIIHRSLHHGDLIQCHLIQCSCVYNIYQLVVVDTNLNKKNITYITYTIMISVIQRT